jgi:AraC-like DNA-binding protein
MQVSSCDDPVTILEAHWGMATLSSLEGDHRAALRDLERLMPLAHIVGESGHPAYFKFLNSYALELSESGRTRDAEQVANLVAASPLIGRYPEWQETVSEIESRRKRRSFIAVASGHKPKPIRDRRIQAVIKFMKANLQRRVSLDEFAAVANLSKSHFMHLFKTETGVPPGEYLIRLRIEKARDLLAAGSFSVKEVMALVGYGAKTNFAHLFKRYYGFPPSEYRRRALAPIESAEVR